MTPEIVHMAGTVGLWAAEIAILVFVGRYALTRWTDSPEGRHMMTFSVVLLVALTWASIAVIIDLSDMTNLVFRFIVWWSLFGVLVWRDRMLFAAQKRKRIRLAAHIAALLENSKRDRDSAAGR